MLVYELWSNSRSSVFRVLFLIREVLCHTLAANHPDWREGTFFEARRFSLCDLGLTWIQLLDCFARINPYVQYIIGLEGGSSHQSKKLIFFEQRKKKYCFGNRSTQKVSRYHHKWHNMLRNNELIRKLQPKLYPRNIF